MRKSPRLPSLPPASPQLSESLRYPPTCLNSCDFCQETAHQPNKCSTNPPLACCSPDSTLTHRTQPRAAERSLPHTILRHMRRHHARSRHAHAPGTEFRFRLHNDTKISCWVHVLCHKSRSQKIIRRSGGWRARHRLMLADLFSVSSLHLIAQNQEEYSYTK